MDRFGVTRADLAAVVSRRTGIVVEVVLYLMGQGWEPKGDYE